MPPEVRPSDHDEVAGLAIRQVLVEDPLQQLVEGAAAQQLECFVPLHADHDVGAGLDAQGAPHELDVAVQARGAGVVVRLGGDGREVAHITVPLQVVGKTQDQARLAVVVADRVDVHAALGLHSSGGGGSGSLGCSRVVARAGTRKGTGADLAHTIE